MNTHIEDIDPECREHCPNCYEALTRSMPVAGSGEREPGTLSICKHCREFSVFTDEGGRRPVSITEDTLLRAKPEIQQILAAMEEVDDGA